MAAPNLGSLLGGTSQLDNMKGWYRACFAPEENEMGALHIRQHSTLR
jgi:hypothetical protein